MDSANDRGRVGTRAAGFCVTPGCPGRATPIPLEPAGPVFECERCGRPGRVVREEVLRQRDPGDVVDEVRVAYGYDAERDCYTFVEVAREPSLLGRHNVVHVRSPLIQQPAVARMLAEVLLAHWNERLRRREVPALRPTRTELVAQGWKVLF